MTQKRTKIVIRAKEFPDFVVDRNKGSLLNTNNRHLSSYKRQRSLINSRANKLNQLEQQIQQMHVEMLSLVGKIQNVETNERAPSITI